jgi:hypothetical protein
VSLPISWSRNPTHALCNSGNWTAQVALIENPILSFLAGHSQPAWQVHFSPRDAQDSVDLGTPVPSLPLGDCYVRQSDLVTQFQEHEPLRFGYEVYFCAKPTIPNAMLVELWLSVQTSTLESHPQLKLSMSSQFLPTESPSMYLSKAKTCGMLIHPLDGSDVSHHLESDQSSSFLVFGRFMEKGVIRRMRCQLIASSVELTAKDCHQLFDSFSQSPLPLTA